MPFLLLIFLSSHDSVSTLLLAKFTMSLSDGKDWRPSTLRLIRMQSLRTVILFSIQYLCFVTIFLVRKQSRACVEGSNGESVATSGMRIAILVRIVVRRRQSWPGIV